MHAEAMAYLERRLTLARLLPIDVIEFGSLDVNGSPRALFSAARSYVGVDIEPGPGVDVVADAATLTVGSFFDVALCCEVFEHTAAWPNIVETAYRALRPGGIFVVTAACDPRAPHGAYGQDGEFRPGEYYCNVEPGRLDLMLAQIGFVGGDFATHERGDVYATVWKRS